MPDEPCYSPKRRSFYTTGGFRGALAETGKLPKLGGETYFVSMYAASEASSPPMQTLQVYERGFLSRQLSE